MSRALRYTVQWSSVFKTTTPLCLCVHLSATLSSKRKITWLCASRRRHRLTSNPSLPSNEWSKPSHLVIRWTLPQQNGCFNVPHQIPLRDATPPPLNYIHFTSSPDTSSTIPTVSVSSTKTSQSRRRHFPRKNRANKSPRSSAPSCLHQLTNLWWIHITENIIDDPSLVPTYQAIDTDLSGFLLEVYNAEYDEVPSLILAKITTFHQIATVQLSIIQQHDLANLYFKNTISSLNWWAQKHRLCSADLLLLTPTSFDEIHQLYDNYTACLTRRTPRWKQPSCPPRPTIQRCRYHVHSQAPYPQFGYTTILTVYKIYQLAPAYFRLHPDILQTICEHHMSFGEFAVHHLTATTNLLELCDAPTICSMFRNCTFITDYESTTQSTNPSNSVISPSASDSNGSTLHSDNLTTTYSSNNYFFATPNSHSRDQCDTDEKSTNNFSRYTNNHSEYSYPSDQDQDDYWNLLSSCLQFCLQLIIESGPKISHIIEI